MLPIKKISIWIFSISTILYSCQDSEPIEPNNILFNNIEDFTSNIHLSKTIETEDFELFFGESAPDLNEEYLVSGNTSNLNSSIILTEDEGFSKYFSFETDSTDNGIALREKTSNSFINYSSGFISGGKDFFTFWLEDLDVGFLHKKMQGIKMTVIISFYSDLEEVKFSLLSAFTKESQILNTTYQLGDYFIASGQIATWESINTIVDERDGERYRIVEIDSQTWMAENLRFASQNSFYYDNNPSYHEDYGRLYNWDDAMNACPAGWHLPSDREWNNLINKYGGSTIGGGALKEGGTKHWKYPNLGASNKSNLSLLPGGGRNWGNHFIGFEETGFYWTSTKITKDTIRAKVLIYDSREVYDFHKVSGYGFSVRCVKN